MSEPPLRAAQRAALTRINTEDILESLGLRHVRLARLLLAAACRPAAGHFARQVAVGDWLVGQHGLAVGARWLLRQHVRELFVAGLEKVPRDGPLLVVSNHPGVADTVAVFVALPRRDLSIIAADRPFLRALPHVSAALIYAAEGRRPRLGLLREVMAALQDGRTVLTFPGGAIEPDPAIHAGAAAALAGWSESIGLLVRRAPEVQVLPAIVSGVLEPAAQHHPLTRLRRRRDEQERLGAMLQVLVPAYHRVSVRVAFGGPLAGSDLVSEASSVAAITRRVTAAAAELIEHPPTSWRRLLGPPGGYATAGDHADGIAWS